MKFLPLTAFAALVALGSAFPVACSSSSTPAASSTDAGHGITVNDAGVVTGEDAGPPEPTTIAQNLGVATALTVVGGSLYWVENANGVSPIQQNAIRSVATTGGTPHTVVAQTAGAGTGNISGALASDGTSLYYGLVFPLQDAGAGDVVQPAQLMKCGLDGSSPTVVATGLPSGTLNALFVVNGTLYAQSGTGIAFAATSAGGAKAETLHMPGPVTALYAADATGLYYSVEVQTASILYTAPVGFDFYASPLDASSASLLLDFVSDGGSYTFGGAVVAGGDFYIAQTLAPLGTISELPTTHDAGAETTYDSLTEWSPTAIVADAKSLYFAQSDGSNQDAPPGVYSLPLGTPGATPTQLHVAPFGAYGLALDATNLYWFEDTGTPTVTLHATPR